MPATDFPNADRALSDRKRRFQRLVSVVAIVFGSGFFACAGCCVLGVFLFGPKNVDTPAGAERVAEQITNLTVPKSFSGKSGITLDNFVFRLEIARFNQSQGRGVLIIGQMYNKWAPGADLHPQLQEFMERLAPDLRKIDAKESETRTRTINVSPAKFEIARGEDRATTTRYRRVIGRFKGKIGNALVILECEDEFLTEQEIDDFVNSIH
jgi:hypothetical protein